MDDWTDEHCRRMVRGGNARWAAFWEGRGGGGTQCTQVTQGTQGTQVSTRAQDAEIFRRQIKAKYESNMARAYREALSLDSKQSTNNDNNLCAPMIDEAMPAPLPSFEAKAGARLEEEFPPSFQDVYKVAWHLALSMMGSGFKARLYVFGWGVLGMASACGVHLWGSFIGASSSVTSSLPSMNPMAPGNMGAEPPSENKFGFSSFFALGILLITIGMPYFFLHRFALRITRSWLVNRQDAFKSARNLLVDRIKLGRAKRLSTCDVYYPPIPEGGG